MSRIGPCVSIFGSARTKPDNPYYQLGVMWPTSLPNKALELLQEADQVLWKPEIRAPKPAEENRWD